MYSGSILLKNMRLKASMFDASPVPFKLVYGQIGKIFLKIPLWDMFKSPLEIEISDVIGIVATKPISHWREEQQQTAWK
jgi:hypothetical protein